MNDDRVADHYRLHAEICKVLTDPKRLILLDALRSGDTPFGRVRELPSRILFGRDGSFIVGYSGVGERKKLDALVKKELDAR